MEQESKTIIEDRVKKLPPEVRDVLASDELHKKIVGIGEKHHLHIDQIGVLEDEVVLVMMGLANPGDLAEELTKQSSLELPKAEEVVADVSQEIFLPIREAMKKFAESNVAEKSVVMPSAASVTNTAPTPTPIPPILATPAPAPTTPVPAIKPAEIHAADLMLSEPTMSMPPKPALTTPASKVEAPNPAPYKADPYREPPE
jgi:hypothetical protein